MTSDTAELELGGWLAHGLEDDVRPRMFEAADRGEPFALATIVSAEGGPRPVGAQMVITRTQSWGFLSGGCIEDDVARNGRETIEDGQPRTLVYGRGSPFIDIRLPCGGRIEVALECVRADDEALRTLRRLTAARLPAVWESTGVVRICTAGHAGNAERHAVMRQYLPAQRLIVVGSDPFALAIAGLGRSIGWETVLLAPHGPEARPPLAVNCDRRPLAASLGDPHPDEMTAVAVATHDLGLDEAALVLALRSEAGYVGVLGSRRKLDQRLAGLAKAGLTKSQIARLHAPIGLAIDASSPWEVAVAVVGEVIAESRRIAASHQRRISKVHVAA